jgi:hypothetical protein
VNRKERSERREECENSSRRVKRDAREARKESKKEREERTGEERELKGVSKDDERLAVRETETYIGEPILLQRLANYLNCFPPQYAMEMTDTLGTHQ